MTKTRDLQELCGKDGTHRLFNELQQYADPPARIPYLPKPGTYQHPSYGQIAITPERNTRFVENFKSGIYQQHIPIDLEHGLKQSGAAGYVKELLANGDGSVDAVVEWTERGAQALKEDRFRYFSPEFWDEWTEPLSGKVYQDVAIGGGLTTRPYFKDGALRSLVAAEDGALYAADSDGEPEPVALFFHALAPAPSKEDHGMTVPNQNQDPKPGEGQGGGDGGNPNPQPNPQPNPSPNPAPSTFSEADAREFAELKAKVPTMEAQLKQLSEQNAAMAKAARTQRFTELATGRGGATDGAPWVGDVAAHVGLLEALTQAYGEDSDQVKAYVAQQSAAATQLQQSAVFSEIGSSAGSGSVGSAEGKIDERARQLREAEPALTIEQARARALDENPQLYAEYLRGA